MTPLSLLAVAALALVAMSSPASAQQPSAAPAAKADTAARPDTSGSSVQSAAVARADSAAVELARAAMVLAASVEKVAKETANDPAIRVAAIQAAGQAVALAQSTLADHMGEIEKALAEASRRLAELAARQKAQTPTP